MNIYVANLSFDLQDEDLKALFVPYGEVSSARIIRDKLTSSSRGFGFLEMEEETAARKAIAELNGAMAGGRFMKVNEAKRRPDGDFGKWREENGEKNYNNSRSYNQTIY